MSECLRRTSERVSRLLAEKNAEEYAIKLAKDLRSETHGIRKKGETIMRYLWKMAAIIAIVFLLTFFASIVLASSNVILHEGYLTSATKEELVFRDGYIYHGEYSISENNPPNSKTYYILSQFHEKYLWLFDHSEYPYLQAVFEDGN